MFCDIGNTRWRVTNVLGTLKAQKQCVRIQPSLSSLVFAHWTIYQVKNNIGNHEYIMNVKSPPIRLAHASRPSCHMGLLHFFCGVAWK
jgi:hypothetical protein